MNTIGIEFISVLGQPPVDYVHTAAELGIRHIGMAPAPIVTVEGLYPAWSLVEDAGLRRAFKAALAERGVSVSVGEGFLLMPGMAVQDLAPQVDAMAEIGAPVLNVIGVNPDPNGAADQLGAFAELAAARGLRTTIEFVPGTPFGDLPSALDIVHRVGRPDFAVLVDAMHLFRTGSTAADLAAVAPALIGYVQICDVPWTSDLDYADEARFERRAPGDGELPLKDMIAALPLDIHLGLEVPMRARAEAGIGPVERLRPAIAAMRDLVDEVARMPAQETPG
jgi:sugar phosphate isomerase/epimerase